MAKLNSSSSHSLGTKAISSASGVVNAATMALVQTDLDTAEAALDIAEAAIVTANALNALMATAIAGDMKLTISPAITTHAHGSAGWTREVTICLRNAADAVHTWFNGTIPTKVSVADTAGTGTATINSTSLIFTAGVSRTTVTIDAVAWADNETNTVTLATTTIMGQALTGGTSVETIT